jgi:DNA-binding winged helix-turn-helix (wHTH) protein
MRTRFGEFELDCSERQLLREGAPVHLTPKAYGLLCFLVGQGHRAVAKAEILDHLWPSTFVADTALTTVVKELRRALGDRPEDPRYIRGVRGYGYAFVADQTSTPEPPAGELPRSSESRLVWQSREVALGEGENLLGRSHEAVVWVDDGSVSRRHAILHVDGERATIEDCGSRNGTWMRGERITVPRELVCGDEFFLGSARLSFVRYRGDQATGSGSHAADRLVAEEAGGAPPVPALDV